MQDTHSLNAARNEAFLEAMRYGPLPDLDDALDDAALETVSGGHTFYDPAVELFTPWKRKVSRN